MSSDPQAMPPFKPEAGKQQPKFCLVCSTRFGKGAPKCSRCGAWRDGTSGRRYRPGR